MAKSLLDGVTEAKFFAQLKKKKLNATVILYR